MKTFPKPYHRTLTKKSFKQWAAKLKKQEFPYCDNYNCVIASWIKAVTGIQRVYFTARRFVNLETEEEVRCPEWIDELDSRFANFDFVPAEKIKQIAAKLNG